MDEQSGNLDQADLAQCRARGHVFIGGDQSHMQCGVCRTIRRIFPDGSRLYEYPDGKKGVAPRDEPVTPAQLEEVRDSLYRMRDELRE